MSRLTAFLLLIGVLLLSVTSYRLIGIWNFWGLDFQNLYAFHHCSEPGVPYLVTGAQCKDALDRNMIYPPVLFAALSWTKWFSFDGAIRIWAGFVVLGTLVSSLFWVPKGRFSGGLALFLILLFLQVPMVYALERGNNDAPVLLLWAGTFWLYQRQRYFGSGALATAAILYKVYPLFSFLVILGGVFKTLKKENRIQFIGGAALSGIVLLALTWNWSLQYFLTILPRWAHQQDGKSIVTHSLIPLFPKCHFLARLISLSVLAIWVRASWKSLKKDPPLIFAGALAISTYFASTSGDYNLITTYPLLILLFIRAFMKDTINRTYFWLLLAGVVAIAGNRFAFLYLPYPAEIHTLSQVVWLCWIGLFASGHSEKGVSGNYGRESTQAPIQAG